ncbi:unnamed protein product, partial [Prorocentrum cordatum]
PTAAVLEAVAASLEAERAAVYARNLSGRLDDVSRLHAEVSSLASQLREVRAQQTSRAWTWARSTYTRSDRCRLGSSPRLSAPAVTAAFDMTLLPRLHLYMSEGSAAEAGEFFSERLPGRVFTFHCEDDRSVWHERVLIWPAVAQQPPTKRTIVTPDDDVYDEEIASGAGGGGPSIVSLTFGAAPARQRPAGRVHRSHSYPTEAESLDLVCAARRGVRAAGLGVAEPSLSVLVTQWAVPGFYHCLDCKAPGHPPTTASAVLQGGPHLPPSVPTPPGLEGKADDGEPLPVEGTATPPPGPVGVRAPACAEPPPPGTTWVASKAAGAEIQHRDEISPSVWDVIWGEGELYDLPTGFIVPTELVPSASAIHQPAERDDDARLLCTLTRNHEGRHHRVLGESVNQMRQEAREYFPLARERSYEWLCEYSVEHGGTSDGRPAKWMSESGCAKDSAAVHFYDLLGLSVDLAQTCDEVDGSDLACMEAFARTYPLVEETAGSIEIEGVEHHVGHAKQSTRRGVALAPGQAKYATEQLAKETEIQKQQLMAREEKSALAGKKAQG